MTYARLYLSKGMAYVRLYLSKGMAYVQLCLAERTDYVAVVLLCIERYADTQIYALYTHGPTCTLVNADISCELHTCSTYTAF
jgi:hypothetical protein